VTRASTQELPQEMLGESQLSAILVAAAEQRSRIKV
jgi:hypothetical protein